MMLKKKRSDKKRSVKFSLVPRAQRDPLVADNEAPPNVLVPVHDGADIDHITQKLRDIDPRLFPSKEKTKVGMLERAHAADGMTLDPEIMNAMSTEFNYEDPDNLLDDDFMDQAGGLIEDEGELLESELIDVDLFGDDDDHVVECETYKVGPKSRLHCDDDDDDESVASDSKTVFTNYSMTSSVMRRNQGLQQIDEHFERLYEQEYADDTEIGALDLNEVKGEQLLQNIDQIREMKKEIKVTRQRNHGDDYEPEIVSDHHKNAIIGDDPEAEDEDLVETEIRRRENRVDCESILTYNSSLYNHPKLIVEPRKKSQSQASVDQTDIEDPDKRSRSNHAASIASSRATILAKLSTRPTNETLEEKRSRKKALKQYRHERRQERKQNQMIFKTEEAALAKQQRSNQTALKLV